MEQLVKEVQEWLMRKYDQKTIDFVGLSDYEDIARILMNHRELVNYNYKNFISDYIEEQINFAIMSIEEE